VIAWKGGSAAVDESLRRKQKKMTTQETPLDSAPREPSAQRNAEKKESASCGRRSVGRCLCRNLLKLAQVTRAVIIGCWRDGFVGKLGGADDPAGRSV